VGRDQASGEILNYSRSQPYFFKRRGIRIAITNRIATASGAG